MILAQVRAAALLTLLLVPIAGFAADSIARVEAYLAKLSTLTADFVQVVQDKQGQVTLKAKNVLFDIEETIEFKCGRDFLLDAQGKIDLKAGMDYLLRRPPLVVTATAAEPDR